MNLAALLLLSLMLLAVPNDSRTSQRRGKDAPHEESRQTTVTGCLDQRGEQYVIRSTDDMSRVTTLEGKGFSNDNFARYIGRLVKVHGGASNAGTFEVTKIEKVADTCSK